MRIFRPKYKNRKGKKKQTRTFWVEFRGPDRQVRKFSLGTTDEDVAVITETQLNSLNEWAKKELSPPEDLVKWVRRQDLKLRNKIYECGLLKAEHVNRTKTIKEHLDDYIRDLQVNSDNGYPEQIKSHIEKIIKSCGFEFWTDVVGKGPEIRKMADDKFSSHTANHYLTSFKMFGNWLVKHGRVKDLPVIDSIDYEVPKQRAFEESELVALYEATRNGPEAYGLTGHQRYVLYKLAFNSGLRRDELRSLTRNSFDFNRRIVFVPGTDTKNSKEAYQKLTPETVALVKDLVRDIMPDVKIFDVPNNSAEMIRKDAERAGIELENWQGKVKFHSLRHSLATHLASRGVPPHVNQKIMRHADITTTMKYYTHLLRGDEDDAIDKLRGFGDKPAKEQIA